MYQSAAALWFKLAPKIEYRAPAQMAKAKECSSVDFFALEPGEVSTGGWTQKMTINITDWDFRQM